MGTLIRKTKTFIRLVKNSLYPEKKVENNQLENRDRIKARIRETIPIHFRNCHYARKRLNLMIPSVNCEHVFGGIATAFRFFKCILEASGWDGRIIVTDASVNKDNIDDYVKKFKIIDPMEESSERMQLIDLFCREDITIPVSQQDYFVFTSWNGAFCIQEAYSEFKTAPNVFLYLIQDYEPGFYSWSDRYILADSTYSRSYDQIAIFNSSQLQTYFSNNDYYFAKEYCFEPKLNTTLRKKWELIEGKCRKKKKIIIYGRPSTSRNAFDIIIEGLRYFVSVFTDAKEWEFVSAGEKHEEIVLADSIFLKSLGKLTLDEYAQLLEEAYAGVSLMVSPHPSYPPLEMATFGINVITNAYKNKDLSCFCKNIISINDVTPRNIGKKLKEVCSEYSSEVELPKLSGSNYIDDLPEFGFVEDLLQCVQEQRK